MVNPYLDYSTTRVPATETLAPPHWSTTEEYYNEYFFPRFALNPGSVGVASSLSMSRYERGYLYGHGDPATDFARRYGSLPVARTDFGGGERRVGVGVSLAERAAFSRRGTAAGRTLQGTAFHGVGEHSSVRLANPDLPLYDQSTVNPLAAVLFGFMTLTGIGLHLKKVEPVQPRVQSVAGSYTLGAFGRDAFEAINYQALANAGTHRQLVAAEQRVYGAWLPEMSYWMVGAQGARPWQERLPLLEGWIRHSGARAVGHPELAPVLGLEIKHPATGPRLYGQFFNEANAEMRGLLGTLNRVGREGIPVRVRFLSEFNLTTNPWSVLQGDTSANLKSFKQAARWFRGHLDPIHPLVFSPSITANTATPAVLGAFDAGTFNIVGGTLYANRRTTLKEKYQSYVKSLTQAHPGARRMPFQIDELGAPISQAKATTQFLEEEVKALVPQLDRVMLFGGHLNPNAERVNGIYGFVRPGEKASFLARLVSRNRGFWDQLPENLPRGLPEALAALGGLGNAFLFLRRGRRRVSRASLVGARAIDELKQGSLGLVGGLSQRAQGSLSQAADLAESAGAAAETWGLRGLQTLTGTARGSAGLLGQLALGSWDIAGNLLRGSFGLLGRGAGLLGSLGLGAWGLGGSLLRGSFGLLGRGAGLFGGLGLGARDAAGGLWHGSLGLLGRGLSGVGRGVTGTLGFLASRLWNGAGALWGWGSGILGFLARLLQRVPSSVRALAGGMGRALGSVGQAGGPLVHGSLSLLGTLGRGTARGAIGVARGTALGLGALTLGPAVLLGNAFTSFRRGPRTATEAKPVIPGAQRIVPGAERVTQEAGERAEERVASTLAARESRVVAGAGRGVSWRTLGLAGAAVLGLVWVGSQLAHRAAESRHENRSLQGTAFHTVAERSSVRRANPNLPLREHSTVNPLSVVDPPEAESTEESPRDRLQGYMASAARGLAAGWGVALAIMGARGWRAMQAAEGSFLNRFSAGLSVGLGSYVEAHHWGKAANIGVTLVTGRTLGEKLMGSAMVGADWALDLGGARLAEWFFQQPNAQKWLGQVYSRSAERLEKSLGRHLEFFAEKASEWRRIGSALSGEAMSEGLRAESQAAAREGVRALGVLGISGPVGAPLAMLGARLLKSADQMVHTNLPLPDEDFEEYDLSPEERESSTRLQVRLSDQPLDLSRIDDALVRKLTRDYAY